MLVMLCYNNTTHIKKFNDTIENLKRPLIGLKNQAEQLMHVEKVECEEELVEFPDLKERLLFKILTGIDDELILIKNGITQMNSLNQDLRSKLDAFEKSTGDFDWYNDDENSGSAFQPRLSDLLQMAYESWKFYSTAYQSISSSFKSLNIRNEKSITNLQESLQIKSDIKDRLNYILALTQYCSKHC